jgi:cytochrome bd ubiquinol oxidase subunit I
VLEGLWLKTGKRVYLDLFKYWMKIFALAFAMGVVSGIVMSYQFGTNWSVFSDKAGPVIGPLMAYEVLTAFFLEAGFLGVMLFGMNKVGKKLHFTATLMVALGTFVSAFWILSVNSWMQTPTGYFMAPNGQFMPGRQLVGPSSSTRLPLPPRPHGAGRLSDHGLRGGRGRRLAPAARPQGQPARAQDVLDGDVDGGDRRALADRAGDLHGLNTLEHQPAKVMAMEGHYQSHPEGAPLILFGIPNSAEDARATTRSKSPRLSSLILKHD